MNLPKISLVVPIYGVEKYIEKCCETLFVQNYPNIEYVFVNDCTKDKSIELLKFVLEKHPERKEQVKIINHERNLGLGGTRLTGVNNSTGDYVWFIDSDDFIADNALSELTPYFKGDYDLIAFSYLETKDGEVVNERIIKDVNVPNLLTYNVSPSVWKICFKRDVMINNHILPVQGVNYAEDTHVTLRLCLASKKCITLPDLFLYNYNIDNENSIVHNIDVCCLDNMADALCLVYDFYNERNALKRYPVFFACMLADCYLKTKKHETLKVKSERLLQHIKSLDYLIYMLMKVLLPVKFKVKLYSYYSSVHWFLYKTFKNTFLEST